MADTIAEKTPPALFVDAPNLATSEGPVEKDKASSAEPETEECSSGVETKMEAVEAGEEEEEKPVASTDRQTISEEAAAAAMDESRDEATVAVEEREPCQRSTELGSGEPTDASQQKEAKEEPGEDSRCTGMECEKSKAVCEDGDKPGSGISSSSAGGGGGGCGGAELDKRRPSVEISSSDGEPLSRMDSEDRWVSWRDFSSLPAFVLHVTAVQPAEGRVYLCYLMGILLIISPRHAWCTNHSLRVYLLQGTLIVATGQISPSGWCSLNFSNAGELPAFLCQICLLGIMLQNKCMDAP